MFSMEGHQAADSDTRSSGHGRRKKKTVHACKSCRTGKRKCDGVRPICGTCAKRSTDTVCVFDQPETRRAHTFRQIELLNARVTELEDERTQLLARSVRTASNNAGADAASAPSPYASSRMGMIDHSLAPHVLDEQLPQPAAHFNSSAPIFGNVQNPTYQTQSDLDEDNITSTASIDGMGAIAGDMANSSDLDPNSGGYFGSSSTVNFVAQIQNILTDPQTGRSDFARKYSDHSNSSSRHLRASQAAVDHYSLPTRRYADHLVKLYWTNIHPLYPFLDEVDFERCYSQLWVPQKKSLAPDRQLNHDETQNSPRSLASDHAGDHRPNTKIFHCLLNMIFTLGCHSDELSSTRSVSNNSEIFWQRCKHLLEMDLDVFNTGSLQLVQVMLLMGLYLQTTNLTGACWNIVGMAVRLAQGLGLYLPPRRANKQTSRSHLQLAYESNDTATRWRVWTGCRFMERAVSMTYGRPPMVAFISSSTLRPSDALRATLDSTTRPESLESKNRIFYEHALQLQEIQARILSIFYDETAFAENLDDQEHLLPDDRRLLLAPAFMRRIEVGDFQELVKLEASLDKWEGELPAWLKLPDFDAPQGKFKQSVGYHDGTSHHSTQLERQTVVLRVRYLYGRILAFRPLLLQQLAWSRQNSSKRDTWKRMSSTLGNNLIAQASIACSDAAQELVALVSRVNDLHKTALPEPWCTVFYMYTCAMVLLVAHLCPSVRCISADLKMGWMQCLEILRMYQETSRTALRCVKLLELTEAKLWVARQEPRRNNSDILNDGREGHSRADATATAEEQHSRTHVPMNQFSLPDQTDGMQSMAPNFHFSIDPFFTSDLEADSWGGESIDMTWLSTIPFGINFDETIDPLW